MNEEEKGTLILNLLVREHARAIAEHPNFSYGSIDRALIILVEEVGEVANAILDGTTEELKSEIAQVMAVCFRFLDMLIPDED